jgi:hypothetical protein
MGAEIRHHIRIEARGFEKLGSGCFSALFASKSRPDVAFKVGPLGDGWLIWAAYCQSNGNKSP